MCIVLGLFCLYSLGHLSALGAFNQIGLYFIRLSVYCICRHVYVTFIQ